MGSIEVLPCDWVAAGDTLRAIIGQPAYTGKPRFPTPEECAAWEEAFPGSMARWRAMARLEADTRVLRERHRRLL